MIRRQLQASSQIVANPNAAARRLEPEAPRAGTAGRLARPTQHGRAATPPQTSVAIAAVIAARTKDRAIRIPRAAASVEEGEVGANRTRVEQAARAVAVVAADSQQPPRQQHAAVAVVEVVAPSSAVVANVTVAATRFPSMSRHSNP